MLILFFLPDRFAGWEAAYLSSALTAFGHTVRTVSRETAPIHSLGGFTLLPDYAAANPPPEFDGLVLIGGDTWRGETAPEITALIQKALVRRLPLGAICDAAGFLGTLGLLNRVRHTCNDPAELKRWAGDRYTGERLCLPRQAVRDGTLVTANGTAALEFAREYLLAADAAPPEEISAWYQFHKLGCCTAPLPGM